jgi:aminoglycoside phosphotransferase (APT) family kinase protein
MPKEDMPGPRTTPREEAAHWLDVAREAEAPRLLVELLEDLVESPPRASGPPTPVHGDPKVANCLWRDGRLAALLDWEMAHVGEPLTDLGYLTSFFDMGEGLFAGRAFALPGWWDRARAVAEWESLTARTAVDLRRYEILGLAKIAAIICLGVHLFRTGRASDPRFGRWERIVPAFLEGMRRRAEG